MTNKLIQEELTDNKEYLTLNKVPLMTNGIVAICNGYKYFLDIKHIDDFTLQLKDGNFHLSSGDKSCVIIDGYKTGDTISTGLTQGNTAEHTANNGRKFKGRLPGRLKAIEKYLLDAALLDYEAALASTTSKGMNTLPYWAERFNVKSTTVRGWLIKHRAFRKIKPMTFGDLFKADACR